MIALVRCLLVVIAAVGWSATVQADSPDEIVPVGGEPFPLAGDGNYNFGPSWGVPSPLSQTWLATPPSSSTSARSALKTHRFAGYQDLISLAAPGNSALELRYMPYSANSVLGGKSRKKKPSTIMQIGHSAMVGGIMVGGSVGKYIAAGGASLYALGLISSL